MAVPAIELKNITKRFGKKALANDNISLTINRGEILALLGENGSGKTTLMNMISGIYHPDSGEIFIDGKRVAINSPKDAFGFKIGMIHQHFKLVDVFTATENIILGIRKTLNIADAKKKISAICQKYGFEVNLDQKIYEMTVSQKQTVEIVKVLYRGADILILDEPTAVLTPQESDKLFAVLRNMRNDGKAIVIITHKMHEVEAISDRVAVLRKGKFVGALNTKETTAQEMTNLMVGHQVSLNINNPEPVNTKPRLSVENLTVVDLDGIKRLDDVSFTAMSGEIFGIAGISGSGQRELLEAIAGLQKVENGHISFINDDGSKEELIGKDPKAIKKMGVALSFVPEDRFGMGLVANMGTTDNMMLRSYSDNKGLFVDRKPPTETANYVIKTLEVVTPGLQTPLRKLSGGNVQKVLVGREIYNAPAVLMTAYATRGLDIGASYIIYNMVIKEKQRGSAVIYVGEDLDVILELCDRVLVLCGGKVSGIVECRKTDKRTIGAMMTRLGGIQK